MILCKSYSGLWYHLLPINQRVFNQLNIIYFVLGDRVCLPVSSRFQLLFHLFLSFNLTLHLKLLLRIYPIFLPSYLRDPKCYHLFQSKLSCVDSKDCHVSVIELGHSHSACQLTGSLMESRRMYNTILVAS